MARKTKPARVALIGMGAMGKGLFYQCQVTSGVKCVAVAELKIERAIEFVESLGVKYRVVRNLDQLHDAISGGELAVCDDGELISRAELADVVLESTNSIIPGLGFSITALEHGKHLVLMNAEIDLIFGPYLHKLAKRNGVTYTSCDGDQHGVIKRVVSDLRLWGFELVMGGNIKGFLDRYSNPTKIVPEADKRNLDYKMCTAYTDGTKLNIEMSLLANALNMKTEVPGMHGPRAKHVSEVTQVFDLEKTWEKRSPVVDYLLGAQPDGGVFAVGYSDHPYQKEMMKYYKMGEGPFYVFYRPYHLCHVEAMQSVLEAMSGKSLLEPTYGFQTNVFSYAKKDLQPGDKLDGIGGYGAYGLIENCDPNVPPSGLPICLAEDIVVKKPIAKDQKVLVSDVEIDPMRFDFRVYLNHVKWYDLMESVSLV